MLSRVADTLWWMSRFVERAEGVTRIVQVHRDSDLETEFSQGAAEYWNSALIALYAQNEFELGKFLWEPYIYFVSLSTHCYLKSLLFLKFTHVYTQQ